MVTMSDLSNVHDLDDDSAAPMDTYWRSVRFAEDGEEATFSGAGNDDDDFFDDDDADEDDDFFPDDADQDFDDDDDFSDDDFDDL